MLKIAKIFPLEYEFNQVFWLVMISLIMVNLAFGFIMVMSADYHPISIKNDSTIDTTNHPLVSDTSEITTVTNWFERIKLPGTISGDFRWMQHGKVLSKGSRPTTDLYIRKIELAVETDLLDWASAIIVLNSEYIGDFLNINDDNVKVDEVHFDIQFPNQPYSLVFGKRTQPFGLFDDYLITDPLTQDGYETKCVGISFGYNGPLNSEIVITPYKGNAQMDQLFTSGLFDSRIIQRDSISKRTINSSIISFSFIPVPNYLTLFSAYLSEPGKNKRNTSMNLGMIFHVPFMRKLLFDGEYMQALSRENYFGFNRSFNESALSVSAVYLFSLRARNYKGGGNFKGRRSGNRAHPIDLAIRYEYFNDDSMSDLADIWSVKNRISLGGRYSFFEDKNIIAYFEMEIRLSKYRVPPHLTDLLNNRNKELYMKLGIDF